MDTDTISAFRNDGSGLSLIATRESPVPVDTVVAGLTEVIEEIAEWVSALDQTIDNRTTRVYATGVLQRIDQTDADRLVNRFYVTSGLLLNIISPELERFYRGPNTGRSGARALIEGIIEQEFRRVVVCGSFQNSLNEIETTIDRLQRARAAVLSPASTRIKPESVGTDFVLFDYQDHLENERDTWRHKYDHMNKFRNADAIIVCNPGGIVGKGTMFELGFMTAVSKRVIFTEEPVGISVLFPFEIGV